MNRGKFELFLIVVRGLLIPGLDVREQRQLGEKILQRWKWQRKRGELFQVLKPVLVIGKVLLQILLVARLEDVPDHLRRARAHG